MNKLSKKEKEEKTIELIKHISGNVEDMQDAAEICLAAACTIALDHHLKKGNDTAFKFLESYLPHFLDSAGYYDRLKNNKEE
ncbi:MAG: hypothetical protein LBC39_02720 [Methanobrevibacter sp.]|jgi:hypothetical protein|nr:hypothetical protein [Candidatus Methanovirga aequatorialis]